MRTDNLEFIERNELKRWVEDWQKKTRRLCPLRNILLLRQTCRPRLLKQRKEKRMRLIDADELLEKTECLFKDLNSTEDFMGIGYNHGVGDSIAIIKNAPNIEAEPVRWGRWEIAGREDPCIYYCSECHHMADLEWPYCAECGARMEGEE